MKVPRPRVPKQLQLDADDLHSVGVVAVYSVLVLWVAFIAGLAIRVFLLVSGLWAF